MFYVNFESEKNLLPSVARREHKIGVVRSVHAERVLILAPHPDDDVFGCGGFIYHLAHHKAQVNSLYFSDGTRGNHNLERSEHLIEMREEEAVKSLRVLGGQGAKFLRLPDGELDTVKNLDAIIFEQIKIFNPDLILTPNEGDWHPDHLAVTKGCYKAVDRIKNGKIVVWQYCVWGFSDINRLIKIDEYLSYKKEAIRCHKSQLKVKKYDEAILGLNEYLGKMIGVADYAEGYFEI